GRRPTKPKKLPQLTLHSRLGTLIINSRETRERCCSRLRSRCRAAGATSPARERPASTGGVPNMSQNVPFKKNLELAAALAAGCTVTAAAERFGISRKTVQRKLMKPAFRKIVTDMRNQMVGAAVGRMSDHMVLAADALVRLLESDEP